jgi:predicted cation transporter
MMQGNHGTEISVGLFIIFGLVLLLPFLNKRIQQNLELFLLSMGFTAITLDHLLLGPVSDWTSNLIPAWNLVLVEKAFKDPVQITVAVLAAGMAFHYGRDKIERLVNDLTGKMPLHLFSFCLVIILGLLSSIITAIIASLVLAEIVTILRTDRQTRMNLTIITCFSIGLGAALTPVGEPLSTIVIKTILEEDFWYLFRHLGTYLLAGIISLAFLAMFLVRRMAKYESHVAVSVDKENMRDVLIRTAKVFAFVMAIVFLGIGFTPITEWYIKALKPETLYWVNTISAILDNATLASAEISRAMSDVQIKSAIMGLLISGGMLIPGNIPNIISANRLGISSKEWARFGVPLGLILMGIFFAVIFVPKYV